MEDFVTYDQACKLRVLGFDWKCRAWYNTHGELWTKCPCAYPAPTLAQAQKWLREKGIILLVLASSNLETGASYFYHVFKEKSLIDIEATKAYRTYEEALLEGINDAIELQQYENKINS